MSRNLKLKDLMLPFLIGYRDVRCEFDCVERSDSVVFNIRETREPVRAHYTFKNDPYPHYEFVFKNDKGEILGEDHLILPSEDEENYEERLDELFRAIYLKMKFNVEYK